MRIPSSHSRRTPIDLQGAMTPLIDVVFQLLIFFICASTGHLREMLLPTDFAAGSIGDAAPRQIEKPLGEVRIKLRREIDTTIFQVEGVEVQELERLEGILKSLAETARDIPVILQIDGNVPLGDAVGAYDACRAVRFQTIHFAADPALLRRK
jgi:biopolymer transport protein ExbD